MIRLLAAWLCPWGIHLHGDITIRPGTDIPYWSCRYCGHLM